MGKALELVAGYVTAPDTTLTAWTMCTGNSLTIRNTQEGADIRMVQAWGKNQTSGILRIRSPQLHDNSTGIRLGVVADEVTGLLPIGVFQKLMTQDTLVVHQSGSAVAGDVEIGALLIYYDDLPGINGNFIDESEAKSRIVNITTVENTLSLGVAADYSGEEALNNEYDHLKGNTEYALLGYLCNVPCGAVRWRSTEWGNLGIGGPGDDGDKQFTANWFLHLSRQLELPLIPVFNSANVQSVLVDGIQDEDGADVLLTTILAELS